MPDKRDYAPHQSPLKLQQFTRTKDAWQKGLMILQPPSALLQLQQFTRTKDVWQKGRMIFWPPSGPLKLQQFTRTKDVWQKGLMILQPPSAFLQLQQFTRTKDVWQKGHMIFQTSSASFKLQQYTRTKDVSHCIFVGLFWNLDFKRLQEQQPKNTGAKCPTFRAETNNICVALEQHQHLRSCNHSVTWFSISICRSLSLHSWRNFLLFSGVSFHNLLASHLKQELFSRGVAL